MVQGQQAFQNLLIGQVIRPAISGKHGTVQRAVRIGQPLRTLVVQVGQRTRIRGDDLTMLVA